MKAFAVILALAFNAHSAVGGEVDVVYAFYQYGQSYCKNGNVEVQSSIRAHTTKN